MNKLRPYFSVCTCAVHVRTICIVFSQCSVLHCITKLATNVLVGENNNQWNGDGLLGVGQLRDHWKVLQSRWLGCWAM